MDTLHEELSLGLTGGHWIGGGAQMGRNRDRKRILAPRGHPLLPLAEVIRNAWTALDGTVSDGSGENGVSRESARMAGYLLARQREERTSAGAPSLTPRSDTNLEGFHSPLLV